MESDIKRWLSFADEVETKLQTLGDGIYSEGYIAGLSNLLCELRSEAESVMDLSLTDRQVGYFRVNSLAQTLRVTAYFAHHS